MSVYTISGRAKPQSGGLELAIWYLMRLTGVALFVLALMHFSIMHFIFDPANQTSDWIFNQRWNSLIWRTFDWTMLMMVVFHAFMGVRTVTMDYVKGGGRTFALMGLYLVGIVVFVMGTMVVFSVPMPGAR